MSDTTGRRRHRIPRAALIASAFLVAIGVGVLVTARTDPGTPRTPSEPTFSFTLSEVIPIAGAGVDGSDVSVEEAASETLELVSALYAEAFLRTENWRSGSYEAVWALFEQEAARAARDELETLTAGSEASKRFASIEPLLADLQLEVLTLEGTEPTLVLATARFRAMAALVTGGAVEVTSSGHYFLRRGDAGWRVVAYGVEREDSPVTASTGPNSSTVEPS